MAHLNYLSDEDLYKCVDALLTKACIAQQGAEKKFNKNVIDPFSPLFEMAGFDVSHKEWRKSELTRQSQKSVNSSIGLFHQGILGAISGWEDLGTGAQVDLVCVDRLIIAEVKNKYNTVKGSDLKGIYYELDDLVSRKVSAYKGFTAYYVTIIPNRPVRFNTPFTPSDKEKGKPCPENDQIRKIDGASFYELVTGEDNALRTLYGILPEVIEERVQHLDLSFSTFSGKEKEQLAEYFKLAYGA